MRTQRTILIVDDEKFIQLNLKNILSEENYNIIVEATGKGALARIEKEKVDLAFLDLNLPDIDGLELLERIKKALPNLLVIIMTGYASVESAIKAIKLGAYDYIKKPFKADVIKLITKLGFETLELKKKVKALEEEKKFVHTIDSILGISPEISKVRQQIAEYAKYDSETVLITGESGSGKELAAKSVHALSPRNQKDFIEINCASIPENLLESELFGYEKGAFTDAKQRKIGIFEKANGGTIFLDEIGEMSLALQAKLLRILENKKLRRLGSTNDIEIDVRIIAATNKNLSEAIKNKEFREDLYYRLDVLRIEMPPLRKRGEDVILLAKFFLNEFNEKFKKEIKDFSEEAKELILSYNWPGNIRELKNVIERITILTTNEIIEPEDFPKEWRRKINFDEKDAELDLSLHLGEKSLEEIMESTEIKLIESAFKSSGNNISRAARLLKIPRETLRYKMKKYNISI